MNTPLNEYKGRIDLSALIEGSGRKGGCIIMQRGRSSSVRENWDGISELLSQVIFVKLLFKTDYAEQYR